MLIPRAGWMFLVLLTPLLTGCTGIERLLPGAASAEPDPVLTSGPFTLQLQLDRQTYRPGQAVICKATLHNVSETTRTIPKLDAASLRFAFMSVGDAESGPLRYVDPVVSTLEPLGRTQRIAPNGTVTRPFVFTTLTFERGRFALHATYEQPVPAKTRSQARKFTVQGREAFVKRYPDGIVTREEAIELAQAEIPYPVRDARAVMTVDRKGFKAWWINLYLGDPDDPQGVISYHVNPYLGRVWRETQPFKENLLKDQRPFPKNSRVFDDLREQDKLENRRPTGP